MLRQHALARHVRRAALALLAGAALAGPAVARAQVTPRDAWPATPAQPTDSVGLALGDAIQRALSQSQEVRLARAQVDLARAQVTSARSAALPQINGGVNYVRTFASQFSGGAAIAIPDSLQFRPDTTASLAERLRYLEKNAGTAGLGGLSSLFGNLPFGRPNAWTASLTATQPLFAGGRVGAGLRIASRYREAADLGLQEQLGDIELQVRNAYFQALLAQELERIAAAAVAQADTFLVQERLRNQAGTASDLDVLRAEVSAENLRPQLVQARNAASLATLDLKRLIDIPLAQPVRLTTPLTVPSAQELADPQLDTERLIAQRASIRQQEQAVRIRAEQVKIARAGYFPTLDLSGYFAKVAFPDRPTAFNAVDWRSDATATLALRIPLFNGFRTVADVQEAKVNLRSEELRLVQLRENVELQYQQALGEQRRAAAEITARQRTVEQAQRVYELTVLRYDQGLATQLEVNDARLQSLQARTNLAQSISSFYLAAAGVSRSLGVQQVGPMTTTAPQSPAGPTTPRQQQTTPATAPTTTPGTTQPTTGQPVRPTPPTPPTAPSAP